MKVDAFEMSITKRFTFEAAHHLPGYKGECKYVHGHSYKLFVTISSLPDQLYSNGMIMDFSALKKMVKVSILDRYDHYDLNQFFENPTAEMMIVGIAKLLNLAVEDYNNFGNPAVKLSKLVLYETEDNFVTWEAKC